jgi:hypothetical protein
MFRLPRRDTWDDVPTKISQLWTAVYFAVPILALRVFIEAVIGLQLGKWLGHVPEPLSEARRQYLRGGFAQQTKRKKVRFLSLYICLVAFRYLNAFGVSSPTLCCWLWAGLCLRIKLGCTIRTSASLAILDVQWKQMSGYTI